MRTVFRTSSLSDAYVVHAALLAEGLAATLSGEHSLATIGGGLAVHVASDEDAQVAQGIIVALGFDVPS